MPYPRTRVQVIERIRRDGQFAASLPSTADMRSTLNEGLAWWWSERAKHERGGVGALVSTATATPGQTYVAMPSAQRHVRQVYRQGQRDPALALTRIAYGNPVQEPPLPGVWWPEQRAADGQVIELRPTPSTAETITIIGTSAPPSWTDDVGTVDLVDEDHERAIVDLIRARIHFRDDEAKRQAAEVAAARSLADAMGNVTPQTPTHWRMWQR